MHRILLVAALAISALRADVCDPRKFGGTYGFLLYGETTISGTARPTASMGHLAFREDGSVSGYSSAHFAGILQGNPTTGKYETHDDCSVAWSLQDDSGAFQHFAGTMNPNGQRIVFRQSDPGGPTNGLMVRTPETCSLAALRPRYRFTLSGTIIPMQPGQDGRKVSSSGTARIGGNGKLWLDFSGHSSTQGTVDVDEDCAVTMSLTLQSGEAMNLRGTLVDEGREILGIQTDPGAAVTARFTPAPAQ